MIRLVAIVCTVSALSGCYVTAGGKDGSVRVGQDSVGVSVNL